VSGALPLFARTFLIGLAVAAPVGAMGVLCIQRTLSRGLGAGLATGLGIATADGLYAGLAAFGIAAVSQTLVAWQTPLRVLGGAVLVYLGVRTLLSSRETCGAPAIADTARSWPGLYGSAVALTLTNPMTVMAFGAIFASVGLGATPDAASAAVATAGVALGSLSWWIAVTVGVSVARKAAGERLVRVVNRASGALVTVFGLIAIASALAR